MKYCDISQALAVYAAGGNVTDYLRGALRERENTDAIIEIAYDLQAGSYVKYFQENRKVLIPYIDEIAGILKPIVAGARVVLDVGTGECTTLVNVASCCFTDPEYILGCDISWSRLFTGREFASRELPERLASRLKLFVGNIFRLPLRSKSVDVLWTSHALEPNGGREHLALKELFRVARRLCLFEPCYEFNTAEGQQRMERLGYVRNLRGAIRDLGGSLQDCIRIEHAVNPLNPTYAFIITPPEDVIADAASARGEVWACPSTGHPATLYDDLMYCRQSGLAYPVIRGIPILREGAAILATALGRTVPAR